MEKENHTINYSFCEHPDDRNIIRITFQNTGIDLQNETHKNFVDTIAQVVSAHLCALSQGVPMENVTFETN